MLAGEVAWDLATRDLTAAPFNYSTELAREVATRLFYLGSQVITNWYTLRRQRRLRRHGRLPATSSPPTTTTAISRTARPT